MDSNSKTGNNKRSMHPMPWSTKMDEDVEIISLVTDNLHGNKAGATAVSNRSRSRDADLNATIDLTNDDFNSRTSSATSNVYSNSFGTSNDKRCSHSNVSANISSTRKRKLTNNDKTLSKVSCTIIDGETRSNIVNMPTIDEWILIHNQNYRLNHHNNAGAIVNSTSYIEGLVKNHPDKSIKDGTKITIQKFKIVKSYENKSNGGKIKIHNDYGIILLDGNDKKDEEESMDNDIKNNSKSTLLQSGDIITTARMKNRVQYRLGTKKGLSRPASIAAATVHKENTSDIEISQRSHDINPQSDSHLQQQTPMQRILDVFPDMHHDHIHRHLIKSGLLPQDFDKPIIHDQQVQFKIQQTLNVLASQSSYPKSKILSDPNNTIALSSSNNRNESQWKYDYSASSTTYERNVTYKTNVHSVLMHTFPFLSNNGSIALLQKFDCRYYLTFMYIIQQLKLGCKQAITNGTIGHNNSILSEMNINIERIGNNWSQNEIEEFQYWNISKLVNSNEQYSKPKAILLPEQEKALETTYTPKNSTQTKQIKTTLAKQRRVSWSMSSYPNIIDPILIDEIRYTNIKFNEWKISIESMLNRKQLRLQSELDGNSIECNCCYADCAFEEMVSCIHEGHLFCIDCVRRHAEEQIFGCGKLGRIKTASNTANALSNSSNDQDGELNCMYLNGCNSHFSRSALLKALPTKVMEKYDEIQASQALETAGMRDLCKCPKCNFQAIVPESEMIYSCPNCQYQSCRKCGEESHIPLRCEEVEKKDETSARLRVEEAMTKARVRRCPKGCSQPFYKVEGCNKMTCPTCRSFICYVCRQLISKSVGYKHFCQTPHCKHENCNKCPLYSNAEEDDRRAAKEAGLQKVKELEMEKGDVTSRIDVDDILRMPHSRNISR